MSHRRPPAWALAAALTLTPAVAGCASGTGLGIDLVPQAQADKAGAQAWQQIRSETPETGNAEYRQRARRVADRLLKAAGEDPAQWQVEVFKSDQINAFALPGRKIGIYEGMMRLAGSDAELAAVVGHEIGHDEAHHALQRMNTEAVTQLGTSVLGAALGGGQATATLLGAGAQYGIILPYSRSQELEADKLGLTYMAEAGYDPEAALAVWSKMEKSEQQGGGAPPAFLSTHPATEERIARLKALMPEATRLYRAAKG